MLQSEAHFPKLKAHSGAAGVPMTFSLPESTLQPQQPNAPQSWEIPFSDTFELGFPGSAWTLYDTSDDGAERLWALDDYYVNSGLSSVWMAAGGADGLDPADHTIPFNGEWRHCGRLAGWTINV